MFGAVHVQSVAVELPENATFVVGAPSAGVPTPLVTSPTSAPYPVEVPTIVSPTPPVWQYVPVCGAVASGLGVLIGYGVHYLFVVLLAGLGLLNLLHRDAHRLSRR